KISKSPGWSMILYLFLATLPCDILSGFLVFSERVAYSVYLSSPHESSLSVLADQECAGALMWTCVTIVYLVAGAILSTELLSPRRQLQRQESACSWPLNGCFRYSKAPSSRAGRCWTWAYWPITGR